MHCKPLSLAFLTIFFLLRSAFAAPGTSPAPANPPASNPAPRIDPDRWPALLQQLGSSDFAQRQAAQKQLDQTTWRDLDPLQKSAAAATDPGVKNRLQARLAALNEQLAVDPPPISIELKNATLEEVAAALTKSLGIQITAWPRLDPARNQTFTLSATDRPFWDVFLALSAQHPLTVQTGSNEIRLLCQPQGWTRGTVVGSVGIFLQDMTPQQNADPLNAPNNEGRPQNLTVICRVIIDPRIRVLQLADPAFTEITDDVGNILLRNAQVVDRLMASQFFSVPLVNTTLTITDKKATRIASAKGRVHFVAQTAAEHMDIDARDIKPGQKFTLADRTLVIDRFSAQGVAINTVRLSFALYSPTPPALQDLPPNLILPVHLSIFDADRKLVCVLYAPGRANGSNLINSADFKQPFSLRFSVPTKTKEFTIPFELKDLPLP